MKSEPITLERFAAITAEIEHGAAPPDVLTRAGIDEAAWEEAQEEWMSKLAEETAEQESTDLNTRYQKAFADRLAALEKEARERPAPPAKPAAEEDEEETPLEPDLGAAPDDPAPPDPDPIVIPVVVPAAAAPPRDVSPWAAGTPPQAPSQDTVRAETWPAPPPPRVSAQDTARSEPRPAPPPAPPPAAAAVSEPARAEARTMAFQAAPESLRNPLPFQPAKNEPSGAAPPASLRGAPASPGAPRPPGGGLPFQPAQPPSAGPPSQHVPGAQPPSPRPRNSPAPAADIETPRLTLDQWAQLSAEMAASPGAQAAVCARFGLDAFGAGNEQRAWSKRFAMDRGLYDRFVALYQHYAAWIASRR